MVRVNINQSISQSLTSVSLSFDSIGDEMRKNGLWQREDISGEHYFFILFWQNMVTRADKAFQIVKVIENSTKRFAFERLIEAMVETDQQSLAEKLDQRLVNEYLVCL